MYLSYFKGIQTVGAQVLLVNASIATVTTSASTLSSELSTVKSSIDTALADPSCTACGAIDTSGLTTDFDANNVCQTFMNIVTLFLELCKIKGQSFPNQFDEFKLVQVIFYLDL